jgi:hypothetical protein
VPDDFAQAMPAPPPARLADAAEAPPLPAAPAFEVQPAAERAPLSWFFQHGPAGWLDRAGPGRQAA